MEFASVMNWIDSFESEVIEGNKKIRGWTFSGMNVQLFPDSGVSIVLTPAVRGTTAEERAFDVIREIVTRPNNELFCDLNADRFIRIVKGEENLTDQDWTWSDE